jgi:hypothetical protein
MYHFHAPAAYLRQVSATLVVILAFAAAVPGANAATQSKTITISPFLTEVQVGPGETSKDITISLTNTTDKSQIFAISAVDFGNLNETGGLAFAGTNTKAFTQKYGLAQWLRLPVDHLTLPAGQTTKLQATIANDETLGPGGHYAAIIMSVDSRTGGNSDSVNVQQKISALVFATKLGGEVYDMRLSKIEDDGNWLRLPELFTITFKNTGNVHLVPRGTLKLIAPNGKTVSQGVVNEGSAYVLPETTRQIVVQTAGISRNGWLPGKYTVEVDYRYDGRVQFATKSYRFTYLNIAGIVGFALVAGVIVFFAFKLRIWRYINPLIRRLLRQIKRA